MKLRRLSALFFSLASLLFLTGLTPAPKGVILVSVSQRYLWYVVNHAVLFEAPVAVGMEQPFEYEGKQYTFKTPIGMRKVIAKKKNPVWRVPEWHYFEKAKQRGYDVVRIEPGKTYDLSDGTQLLIKDGQVGRINIFRNFTPIEPGLEIIFDDTLFIPPMGTPQRDVPDALGPFALDMGEGYMIHGTHEYDEDSIGNAASHGCVRMYNEDIERLYDLVEVGTPVYIGK